MKKKIKIAVTGVGGGVGESIVKALYQTDYEIVGLDGDRLATGLYAVPVAYKIPKASDPNYVKALLKICVGEACKLLFPGLDAELAVLSRNIAEFKKVGTTVVVSRPEVIEIADNKFLTYQKLSRNNILVPKTFMLDDYLSKKKDIKFPVVIKPTINGSRSLGVSTLSSPKELDWFISKKDFKAPDYVIQEMLEGDEYTCGTVNLDNKCWGVIVMKRVLRDGDTYKCFTVRNKDIENTVFRVMDILKPFGACNVQLRLQNGVPTIFEINARCSGTTGARALAGFNEPKMIADYLLFGTKPDYDIKNLTILRYWKEMFVENEKIEEFENKGKLINKSFTKL